MLRLVRKLQGFDSLFLMSTAISGSMSVFLWSLVLLSMVQMMLALFLSQYLHEYFFTGSIMMDPSAQQVAVFQYFGTFTRAFFTMFELTLGNWPPVCRLLAENVHESFFLFGMLHKLSIGFAVVGVINGVFMQETFKVAAMDDMLMVRQKERAVKAHKEKMRRFLQEADTKSKDGSNIGDGELSREEFLQIVLDPQVSHWLTKPRQTKMLPRPKLMLK